MTQHIGFLLLGLGNGAVFAALALALVVTFRSSGVVNFATGAVALYTAYLYSFLRKGELLIPIPGLPKTVDLGGKLDLIPAMLVSIAAAAVFGMLLYLVVFRALRTASPVAKAVASIGVMLVVQSLLAARVGTQAMSTPAILPKKVYDFAGLRIPIDRIYFAAVIVVVSILLTVWFRFTKFGLATRATAETEKGALVSGLSPERIALANWAISSAVAGLSGILIAPIVPLIPISYTLFIVPALAAALVGNFVAIGPAVAAALVIGMLQSELQFLQGTHTWLPQGGALAPVVPLVLILIFLVVRGRPLPSRGAIIQQSLGRAPRPKGMLIPAVVSTVIGVVALLVTNGGIRGAVIMSLIFGIIAVSTVVVTGYAGQVSLAQLTLAGAGAFMLNRLTESLGVPFPFGPILAAIAAMVIGVIIGLPALRIRGLPVAVVTLALAVALEAFWFRNNDLNGGLDGAPIKSPTLFGYDFGAGAAYPRVSFGLLCLVVLLLVGLGVAKLRTSRLGAAMLAVRANERSAAAAGINVSQTKIVAFAIAAFIAGLGGALLGYAQTLASADSFTAIGGLGLFATIYIAGTTSLAGGIVAGVIAPGGVLYAVLDQWITLGNWYNVVAGVGLILTVVLNPEGIVGPMHVAVDRLRARRRGALGEPSLADAIPDDVTTASREPAKPLGDVVLTVRNVGVRYGGVVAVDDVSFEVRQGEILGLIGPNGAGKTTLIDAISGFAASTGAVELLGKGIASARPHNRIRSGLGRTFQGIELYEDLTVEENVAVGQEAARHGGQHTEQGNLAGGALLDRLFTVLKLQDVRDRTVKELSQGHRQLVSVARALAGQPRVILLDEPAGGLDSTESRWLGQRLRAVRDAGVTVVMIDHDMGLVLDVCDRIVVLDVGKVIADGTPAQVRAHPEVTRAYLGSSHTAQAPEDVTEPEPPGPVPPAAPAAPAAPQAPTAAAGR